MGCFGYPYFCIHFYFQAEKIAFRNVKINSNIYDG